MKLQELRQIIREEISKEILKEYSFKVIQKDGTSGYINSDNINKILFQISKYVSDSDTDFSWISKLTPQDYKNMILLMAKYLSEKFPNFNPDINFNNAQ